MMMIMTIAVIHDELLIMTASETRACGSVLPGRSRGVRHLQRRRSGGKEPGLELGLKIV